MLALRRLASLILAAALMARALTAQTPLSSMTTDELVDGLRDTNRTSRAASMAELRRRGATAVSDLETLLRAGKVERKHGAAFALVQIGSAALPTIRRALADTGASSFVVTDALMWSTSSDSEVVPLLLPLLGDTSARVRTAAVNGLNNYREGSPQVGRLLVRMLNDPAPDVRVEAANQLVQLRDTASRRLGALALSDMIDDPDRSVRRSAVYNLGNMGVVAGPAIPAIANRINRDADPEVRWLSARVLGWLGPQASDVVPVLLGGLHHRDSLVRHECLLSLGEIGVARLRRSLRDSVLTALRVRLTSTNPTTRHAAATALANTGAWAIPELVLASHSTDDTVALIGVSALGSLSDSSASDAPLLAALNDGRAVVRQAASRAVGGIGARVDARLRWLAQSRGPRVRHAALEALRINQLATGIPVVRRCYSLEYGVWSPALSSPSIEGVLPPRALRFSPVPARYARSDYVGFTVEQPADSQWHATGFWIPHIERGEIELDPSPSLSGVRATLRLDDAGVLVGTIRTYWDFPHPSETASVTARPTDCEQLALGIDHR